MRLEGKRKGSRLLVRSVKRAVHCVGFECCSAVPLDLSALQETPMCTGRQSPPEFKAELQIDHRFLWLSLRHIATRSFCIADSSEAHV